MSTNQVERFIAELARDIKAGNSYDVNRVLERRLKPLLEAGQAMRNYLKIAPASGEVLDQADKWDAAIAEREAPHGTAGE